jgi:uncharacterized protein (TIGR01244 family)
MCETTPISDPAAIRFASRSRRVRPEETFMISPAKAFLIALALGASAPLYYALDLRSTVEAGRREAEAKQPKFNILAPGVFLAPQVAPGDLAEYRNLTSIRSVVDLRPDGEAAGQPSADEVAKAARDIGLQFAYLPTPHGEVPDDVVAHFAQIYAQSEKPVLLYCRSGARAARVWALSEASRADGPGADAIVQAVRDAGLSVDAERPEIERRISSRKSS